MIRKFTCSKAAAVLLSLALILTVFAVPTFADGESTPAVYSNVTLIGSTPCAGATAFAPGSSSAPQPIRLAFSDHASDIAANINSYVSIRVKDTTTNLTISSASALDNIVTITLSSALASNTTYTVDFNQAYLTNSALTDFDFTTSKGGTGGGTGGGEAGSQALVLTGKIPTDNAVISGSQTMYLTFSTNIKSNATANAECIKVKNSAGQDVDATVTITDNWTAKITVSNLGTGNYTLNVSTDLEAQSTNTLEEAVVIPFSVA